MRRYVVFAVAAIVGIGSLAACGNGQTDVAAPSATRAPVKYTGPITAPVRYAEPGITLAVPPSTPPPRISWSDAYNTCFSGHAQCDKTRTATVSLASVTIDRAGKIAPDGSIIPLLKNALVYVVSYTGVPCAPAGGPPRLATPTAAVAQFFCTILNFVDAKSGAVAYTVESPAL